MATTRKNPALFLSIEATSLLLALILAVGALFFGWFAIRSGGYSPGLMNTYRAFVTSFQPIDALVALGISASVADWLARLFVITMLGALATFFVQLFLIVRTARHSDPFALVNAARLQRMGLLLIAIFGLGESAVALLFSQPRLEHWVTIGLMVLMGVTFLALAKVFRHGADMRDDLEGTV